MKIMIEAELDGRAAVLEIDVPEPHWTPLKMGMPFAKDVLPINVRQITFIGEDQKTSEVVVRTLQTRLLRWT